MLFSCGSVVSYGVAFVNVAGIVLQTYFSDQLNTQRL